MSLGMLRLRKNQQANKEKQEKSPIKEMGSKIE
jgi:hypothetical protein